ncbi:MAG TPA: hypothetical protein PKA13_15350 [Geminicoccaceae bacterium]|nr:hypothetical protein [Geminicoccus sp.]HMU51151.1 hypothetical protein [Geminicoccaceae bacterium]
MSVADRTTVGLPGTGPTVSCLGFVGCALRANGSGAVLFSSSRPDHIRAGVGALDPAVVTDGQVAALLDLAACRPIEGVPS